MNKTSYNYFISHSSEDNSFAKELAKELNEEGLKVWVDLERLKSGDSLTPEINRAIQQSDCIITVLSPNTGNSLWVRKEIEYAQKLGRKITPVLIEDLSFDVLANWFAEEPKAIVVEKNSFSIKESAKKLKKDLTSCLPYLEERDWCELVEKIHQGRCILVLGTELIRESASRASLWEKIGIKLADKIRDEIRLDWDTELGNYENFLEIASQFSEVMSQSDLCWEVASYCESLHSFDEPIYQALATLPFRLIISTTPDHSFIETAKTQGKNYQCEWYNFRGRRSEKVIKIGQTVFHIFGSTKEPESMVLTEDDLFDWTVAIISNSPGLYRSILYEFSNDNVFFLFLGLGNKHLYQPILFKTLIPHNKDQVRGYVIEHFGNLTAAECSRINKGNMRKLHTSVFLLEMTDFVKELKQRYESLPREK